MRQPRRPDPAVRTVQRLVSSLLLPRPWNLAVFATQIGDLMGKPIELRPIRGLSAGGLPCGVVLEKVDSIVIAYEANSTAYHIEHIVLHEIGHLLLDHAGCCADRSKRATLETFFPGFDPDSVLRVLERTDYDDNDEAQAELFASLVMAESRVRWESAWGRAIFRS
ncbi:hypothetical protein [Nocardia caishijiensis]|uniref:IrrE N-terminal-like domain-containing protein n=1 Tax=Nocardia caishijiensis TaxID=184756 RepID=A0ABQ6YTU4_9NOCA|nr:hypothetical protein [Nocardia caishijiensis]KAF0849190.1 hypothetical protein FNL39_101627 [Nocardia caishijiensis]